MPRILHERPRLENGRLLSAAHGTGRSHARRHTAGGSPVGSRAAAGQRRRSARRGVVNTRPARRGRLLSVYFGYTRNMVMKPYVDQLAALGQSGRLEIFRLLVRGGPRGRCVDEIKRRVRMPGSTLSHHLDTLARCGLLQPQRSGRFIYYAVNWSEAARLIRFLTEDCCCDMPVRPGGGQPAAEHRPARRSRPARRRSPDR